MRGKGLPYSSGYLSHRRDEKCTINPVNYGKIEEVTKKKDKKPSFFFLFRGD